MADPRRGFGIAVRKREEQGRASEGRNCGEKSWPAEGRGGQIVNCRAMSFMVVLRAGKMPRSEGAAEAGVGVNGEEEKRSFREEERGPHVERGEESCGRIAWAGERNPSLLEERLFFLEQFLDLGEVCGEADCFPEAPDGNFAEARGGPPEIEHRCSRLRTPLRVILWEGKRGRLEAGRRPGTRAGLWGEEKDAIGTRQSVRALRKNLRARIAAG